MKMKKLVALILSFAMCSAVLTACGDDDESSAVTTAATTAATTTTAEEPSEPAEPAWDAPADEDQYPDAVKVDLSAEIVEDWSAPYASNINTQEGKWVLGNDATQMQHPLTYEVLSNADAIQVYYTCDNPFETMQIMPVFKVVKDASDLENIVRVEYLPDGWTQYATDSVSATTVYTQQLTKEGILTIPTSALLAVMEEGEWIEQFGIGLSALTDASKFGADDVVDYTITLGDVYLVGGDEEALLSFTNPRYAE